MEGKTLANLFLAGEPHRCNSELEILTFVSFAKLGLGLPKFFGRVVTMNDDDLKRLGSAVRQRREELNLTRDDVKARGGPSDTTLTGLELGQVSAVAKGTLKKLDVGLSWMPGSADRVLNAGGDPTPRDEREAMTVTEEMKNVLSRTPELDWAKSGEYGLVETRKLSDLADEINLVTRDLLDLSDEGDSSVELLRLAHRLATAATTASMLLFSAVSSRMSDQARAIIMSAYEGVEFVPPAQGERVSESDVQNLWTVEQRLRQITDSFEQGRSSPGEPDNA